MRRLTVLHPHGCAPCDGVLKVDGNAGRKTVTVEFDPDAVSVDEIKVAMDRIGYEAEEV